MLNKDTLEIKQANMIGKIVFSLFYQMSHESTVDSDVTHHVAASKEVLSECYKIGVSEKVKVHLSTDAKVDISHTGRTHIFKDGIVKDVLIVPNFTLNLLSVSEMPRQLSCFISFYPIAVYGIEYLIIPQLKS